MNILRLLLVMILSFIFLVFLQGCSGKVKEPAVAGSFYPADQRVLAEMVDGFLSKAENTPVSGRLIALISPHAGFQYSGSVAAFTYRHLKEREIKTVILIGPSHYRSFKGASVYEEGSFKTPLGLIKINRKIASALMNKDADVTFYPDAFEKEHSLEVQIPFLQRVLEDFDIVPILIGSPTRQSFDYLTARLTELMRDNEHIILIASTDLSHYHDYQTAGEKDRKIIDAIERMSIGEVQRYLMSGKGEMCGGYPVLYSLSVARNLGATNGVLYKYANSGDVTGDTSRVVGYAAMGLYKSHLAENEKEALLTLARKTIDSYVRERNIPDIAIKDKRLSVQGATFVTIKTQRGRLRGCMGNILPNMALYQSVIGNAVSACSRDPRFPPMTEKELEDMDIEVTILSPFEPLKDKRDIEIGKHGLYIMKDRASGILLPQVAEEFAWDVNTFLEQVSLKAGLNRDAWKSANLYRFTAEIIQ